MARNLVFGQLDFHQAREQQAAGYNYPLAAVHLLFSICVICAGACAGALLRWLISISLNPVLPGLPMGTLAVNWIGSFFMGIAMALFALLPGATGEFRLLLVTGFLGSLTTFSAFAGEMATMLQQGRLVACSLAISLHVAGSILLVFAGIAAVQLVSRLAAGE